jgi:two-component system LytT family sensor kinase
VLREQNTAKPGILLYFISLFFYVLLSELVFNLLGFTFFINEFFKNLYQASVYLGIAVYINAQINKQLQEKLPWQNNPIKRFISQSFLESFGTNLFVASLFIAFRYVQLTHLNIEIYVQYRTVLIQFILFAIVIELNVVADLARYLLKQWHQSKLQQETFDKEKAQFNLELLRNQINPHFLFNNLNTLSSLIYEDQDKASDFLRMLSKVYRNILEYKNKETVTLSEELAFFENYYQLLSIRFNEMILVEKNIDESMMQKQMIPLTLQLVMENAIKHNVVSKNHPLKITIETKSNYLFVSNVIQKKESLEFSSGLGLKILSSRYAYLSDSPFEVIKTDSTFTLKIPLL